MYAAVLLQFSVFVGMRGGTAAPEREGGVRAATRGDALRQELRDLKKEFGLGVSKWRVLR